jgi:ABC-type antimicrobial peptide transport system permease subunit
MIIYATDKDKTINDFKKLDKRIVDVYTTDKDSYMKEHKESMTSSLIVAAIMLGISLVEIILMTRSSFLSRIKEVGIYRAIGVKKSDIYKMFMGEAFAITSLTSVPGVLFMSYCISVISDINYIGKNYVMNWGVVLLCMIILYVFNIVISLIPVFNTMRKTPAAILARHDLD